MPALPRFEARRLEEALLLLAPATLLAPPAARPFAQLAWVVLWWTVCRPPGRERWVAGIALAVSIFFSGLAAGPPLGRLLAPADRPSVALRAGYREAWAPIVEAARTAAATLPVATDEAEFVRRAFDRLGEVATVAHPNLHLRLVDPDGVPRAWAGAGLVHEPDAWRLPAAGTTVAASFSSVSFLAVEATPAPPLPQGEPGGPAARAWRIVAGRSFSLSPPSFLPVEASAERPARAVFPLSDRPEPEAWTIDEPGLPRLLLQPVEPARRAPEVEGDSSGWDRAAAWAMAVALVAVAVLRGVGRLLLRGTILVGARSWSVSAAAGFGALLAWAVGVPLPWPLVAALAVASGLLAVATRFGVGRPGAVGGDLLAAGGTVAAIAVARLLERVAGPSPGAEAHWLAAEAVAWVLAPALLAVSGLLAGARIAAPSRGRTRLVGAASGLMLLAVAASVVDSWSWAAGSLVVSAVAWRRSTGPAGRGARVRLAPLVLAGALIGSVAVESAGRGELRRGLAARLEAVSPPTETRRLALADEITRHFAGLDAARALARPLAELDRFDLAFGFWRDSPLSRADALSALSVQVPGEAPSLFAFGLPLTPEGELDREPARWSEVAVPGWESALLTGESWIALDGERWALARFWMLPLPGFTERPLPVGDVAAALLRGGPTATGGRLAGSGSEVRLALFSPEGRPLLSPWREGSPRLRPPEGREIESIRLVAPDGTSWGVARRESWGASSLLVRELGWGAGLERVATRTLGLALWALVLLAGAALLALPRAAARDFAVRAVRSYSRRLLLLFTGVVLVPSVAFYALFTGALGRRLEAQQRAEGEAALNSAQRVLGEYLGTLEPGFGLDTALDDALLTWLSRVVQHDVNLYWGGELWASSRRELFSSGLLPRRIPGEVQARLALFGDDLASRNSEAGRSTYLELFAPLRVPGVSVERGRLFLSMPLLAQQEELAGELERLRRRALLVASVLFAGLSILGVRLARNFTRPLDELVESTRRIAAGQPALALQPRELELAALVEAVDRMARRIAEGRDRLTREKQVVERIVENVTSGVVSVDDSGRVQLANRAARRLLGAEPEIELRPLLAAQGALAGVASHLGERPGEPGRWMVRLAGPAGDDREWSVVWAPVPGDGDVAALLIVEDATEVLRGQRLAAWAEMARIIAHDIKNPLTPIRLSTEFLREVWQRDRDRFPEALERCTTNILRQVEELRDIAGDFATYSRLPRLERLPGDLVALAREIVAGYATASSASAGVALQAPAILPCRFDARLLGRALRNLIENALRASAAGQCVEVTVEADEAGARIVVADRGPGVPEAHLSRIFEPYFSTHAGGTGLGLPIAQRIAVEHGGTLTASNRPGGGLAAVITIPS